LITQATSPYYTTKAFECINISMQKGGFATAQLHNQIMTLGEWGWVIGAKQLDSQKLNEGLLKIDFKNIQTQWLNQSAMRLMTSFGKKDFFFNPKFDTIEVNTIHNPVLYRYYLKQNWELY
jgi:spermidine synthase